MIDGSSNNKLIDVGPIIELHVVANELLIAAPSIEVIDTG